MSMHVFVIIPLLLLQVVLVVAIFMFGFKILQLGISLSTSYESGRNVDHGLDFSIQVICEGGQTCFLLAGC